MSCHRCRLLTTRTRTTTTTRRRRSFISILITYTLVVVAVIISKNSFVKAKVPFSSLSSSSVPSLKSSSSSSLSSSSKIAFSQCYSLLPITTKPTTTTKHHQQQQLDITKHKITSLLHTKSSIRTNHCCCVMLFAKQQRSDDENKKSQMEHQQQQHGTNPWMKKVEFTKPGRSFISTLVFILSFMFSSSSPFSTQQQYQYQHQHPQQQEQHPQQHHILTKSFLPTSFLPSNAAYATDYGSFSDSQRTVAEAWRIVDSVYLDRTFNGQDWFGMRQEYVHRNYKSMDEAEEAMQTMIGSLGDKYTRYLPPAKYQSIVDSATGNLFGVGIQLSTSSSSSSSSSDQVVVVADVEPDSPANKAGIRPGDIFIEVDGTNFLNNNNNNNDVAPPPSLDDVAAKLRGPENSKVGIVMQRGNDKLDFILTRKPIQITSVRSYMTKSSSSSVGKVGVIRIKSFSGTTSSTVSDAIQKLSKDGATSYLLDLRGNPGGLLPGGVDTASLFLDMNSPIVYVIDKRGIVDTQSTLGPGIDLTSPLVLLVDSNTASAAEVMTAALQENHRAIIVGKRTFGKGIVQTIRPLNNDNGGNGGGGGVAVTIARYETPNHRNINKAGIDVDISSNVDCALDDAIACVPTSAFRAPPTTPTTSSQ